MQCFSDLYVSSDSRHVAPQLMTLITIMLARCGCGYHGECLDAGMCACMCKRISRKVR